MDSVYWCNLGQPVCSATFLLKMVEVDYYFEPNTESTIINHFIPENRIYGVRMVLHTNKVGGMWWKEMIVNINECNSVNSAPMVVHHLNK